MKTGDILVSQTQTPIFIDKQIQRASI